MFYYVVYTLLVASILSPISINAIYEYQAGENDWHRQHIGKVFEASMTQSHAIVATEIGVMASLRVESGDLAWRQVLPKGEVINSLHVAGKSAVTSSISSSSEVIVRHWSIVDGALNWESSSSHMPYNFTCLNAVLQTKALQKHREWMTNLVSSNSRAVISAIGVVSLASNSIDILDTAHGKVIASWKPTSSEHTLIDFAIDSHSGNIFIALRQGFSKLIFTVLNQHASFQGSKTYDIELVNTDIMLLSSGVIVVVPRHQNSINLYSLNNEKQIDVTTVLPNHEKDAVLFSSQVHSTSPCFSLRSAQLNAMVCVDSTLGFTITPIENSVAPLVSSSVSGGDSEYLHITDETSSPQLKLNLNLPSKIIRCFAQSISPSNINALLVCADGTLKYDGEHSWTRHEALAEPVSVIVVNENDVSHTDQLHNEQTFPSFFPRILRQMNLLTSFVSGKSWFFDLSSSWESLETWLESISSHDLPPINKQAFSLQKQFVVLTKSGSILSVNSRGDVEWVLVLESDHADAHLVIINDDVLALVTMSTITRINSSSGKVLDTEDLLYTSLHIFSVPSSNSPSNNSLLIIDTQLQAHIIGYDIDVSLLRLFVAQSNDGVVFGMRVTRSHHGELVASIVWQFALADTQRISSLASSSIERIPNSFEDSLAKLIGHSFVVITAIDDKISPDKAHEVSVFVLDRANGVVLRHVVHANCVGPVPAVVSENAVIYSLFNTAKLRFELVVMELFQSDGQRNVAAIQQSFVFPHGEVASLGVARTHHGVSSKDIIVALHSGQVLSIPRALLDPKRPLDASAEAQKKGLIQYAPILPLVQRHYISYHLQLHRLDSIKSVPTLLESTSLIFVFGLDMFFSPITPSKAFDTLKEDFNVPFLVLTVSCVTVAIFITQKLSQAKAISMKWE